MYYDPSCKPELPPHRQLLLKAADFMEERGHAKHDLQDEQGHVCFHGALALAEFGDAFGCPWHTDHQHWNASRHMRSFLMSAGVPERLFYNGYPIGETDPYPGCAEWNNQEDLPGEEVVAAMRAAAAWDGPAVGATATAKEEAAVI